ncbi:MAG: translation initiation factor IF-2 [bacterium]|nr:MAG: translation initiation factor IF-2 [bacterium]
MSNVRVDELATELGLSPDDLFAQLKAMGFDVVNVTSRVDRGMIEMVQDMLVGQPRERDTGSRRIVSVRKGASEPEVEVRVEEEPEEMEDLLDEGEVLPEEDLPEGPEKILASVDGDEAALEASAADLGKEAVLEETEVEPEEVETEPSATDEPPPERKSKLEKLPLTALEIEKDLGGVGAEIPKAKVIIQASETVEESEEAKPVEGEVAARKAKGKKAKDEEEDRKHRAAGRKARKPSLKDLIEDLDELAEEEVEVPEESFAEEPALKVVEIKHPVSPQPQRRREAPQRKMRKAKRKEDTEQPDVLKAAPRSIRITAGLTVGDLAGMTGTKASEIIKILLQLGVMATINQTIDPETASLVVSELGFDVEVKAASLEDLLQDEPEVESNRKPRPPVVTVMGHVDHGKTSLLDAVRETDVVSGEAGGITQHIGAHLVNHKKGKLVFLDTPGHEAFTAMRARGARVTDLVVLVVAADDGVKPQTVEAIDHAKAADVPIVVAVNKIDKPEADPDKVTRELADRGIVPEEWGGDVLFAQVSAKQKKGIDDLLDIILLQAEILELSADPTSEPRGTVIESKLDKGRGPVATVLVQKGTLKPGALMVAGNQMGKIRAMNDERGRKLEEAGPSTPVEVIGLSGVPEAGEPFFVFTDELKAKRVAQMRQEAILAERAVHRKVTLEDLYHQILEGEVKDLNVVLKADVQGSVGAIREALEKASTDEVRVRIIHEGTGGINEGDVVLASASNAIIVGFNVRPDNKAMEVVRKEGVDLRFYNVIYDVVKDIRDALRGLLAPVFREEILGRLEVRQTFHVPRIGTVAGCYVTDGAVRRNAQIRVIRDGVVVHDGRIGSLKRFKDDVREVSTGYECGVGLENYNDVKPGDILENYHMVAEEAEL